MVAAAVAITVDWDVRTLERIFLFGPLISAFSLFWAVPLVNLADCAQKRNRDPRTWLALAFIGTPMGWVSAFGLTLVRPGMAMISFLAPILLGLVVRALPIPPIPAGSDRLSRSALKLATAVYAFWIALNTFQFNAYLMIAGSNEKATISNLGSIRSALSIYKLDMEGRYPLELTALIPKYINKLPKTKAITSEGSRIVHVPSNKVASSKRLEPNDLGGWGYVSDPASPEFGSVFINCTHIGLRSDKRLYEY